MNKEMIISSTRHETRVAILEDDQVVELFIEREQSRGVVGNIYKGRVSKVLPGMQSAFVDLGLERDAFLYVTDVISPRTTRSQPRAQRSPRRIRRSRSASRPNRSARATASLCRSPPSKRQPTQASLPAVPSGEAVSGRSLTRGSKIS
jgi:Rne/Rng family ribonuclease